MGIVSNLFSQHMGDLVQITEKKVVGVLDNLEPGGWIPMAHGRSDQVRWTEFIPTASHHQ